MEKRPSPPLEFGNAICYSGYREGQSPVDGTYPTVEQVAEDLRILASHWRHIRLYDCSRHAEIVLEVIRRDGLDLQVMLGAEMRPEQSNPACPWQAEFDTETLAGNRRANSREIDRLIALAGEYASVVSAVSVGNEATVEWTDHLVSVETLIGFVQRIKQSLGQPVTFCENYVPWIGKLEPLAAELDFLSVHTYPVWEYQSVDGALDYTRQNYDQVASHYPDKPVVITEAGWTTRTNGRGIDPENASERFQVQYYQELMRWSRQHRILTYVFEAFDEPWKGSPDPDEPEKHWGLFTVDRRPKLVMSRVFPHLRPVI